MKTINSIESRKRMSSLFLSLLLVEGKINKLNSQLENICSKYYRAINVSDLKLFFDKFRERKNRTKKLKSAFNKINSINENRLETSIIQLENEINKISTEVQLYLDNKN
mgnify:CR=1 FL=1